MPTRHSSGGVLCLDLARITGWCFGPLDWDTPEFGSWVGPETGGEGYRYACLENAYEDAFSLYQPSAVILESPMAWLPIRRRADRRLVVETNQAALRQQYGLRAIVLAMASRRSVPVSEVSADIVRDEILGFHRVVHKPGAIKKHAIAWCERQGWKVGGSDAADACLIWAWHKRRMTTPRQASLLEVA